MTKLKPNRFRFTTFANFDKIVVWTTDKFGQYGFGVREFFLKDVKKKE